MYQSSEILNETQIVEIFPILSYDEYIKYIFLTLGKNLDQVQDS